MERDEFRNLVGQHKVLLAMFSRRDLERERDEMAELAKYTEATGSVVAREQAIAELLDEAESMTPAGQIREQLEAVRSTARIEGWTEAAAIREGDLLRELEQAEKSECKIESGD